MTPSKPPPLLPDTVCFKSSALFFFKERDGQKPNTIRRNDANDLRFHALNDCEHPPKKIKIINAGNPKLHFTRQITDISYYEGWWIISWRHSA